jgi:DivIVA domain-containing protein
MDSLSTQVASHEFPTAKRGYDPAAVDGYLRTLGREISKLEGELSVTRTKLSALEKRIKDNRDADTVVSTAFLAAAESKRKLLEDAEHRAAQMIAEAEAAVAGIKPPSNEELDALRDEAEQILNRARRHLSESREEADRTLREAKQQAEEIVSEARRHALSAVRDGQSEVEGNVDAVRDELQRLVLMLRSLKSAVREGFDYAEAGSEQLRVVLGESATALIDGERAGHG